MALPPAKNIAAWDRLLFQLSKELKQERNYSPEELRALYTQMKQVLKQGQLDNLSAQQIRNRISEVVLTYGEETEAGIRGIRGGKSINDAIQQAMPREVLAEKIKQARGATTTESVEDVLVRGGQEIPEELRRLVPTRTGPGAQFIPQAQAERVPRMPDEGRPDIGLGGKGAPADPLDEAFEESLRGFTDEVPGDRGFSILEVGPNKPPTTQAQFEIMHGEEAAYMRQRDHLRRAAEELSPKSRATIEKLHRLERMMAGGTVDPERMERLRQRADFLRWKLSDPDQVRFLQPEWPEISPKKRAEIMAQLADDPTLLQRSSEYGMVDNAPFHEQARVYNEDFVSHGSSTSRVEIPDTKKQIRTAMGPPMEGGQSPLVKGDYVQPRVMHTDIAPDRVRSIEPIDMSEWKANLKRLEVEGRFPKGFSKSGAFYKLWRARDPEAAMAAIQGVTGDELKGALTAALEGQAGDPERFAVGKIQQVIDARRRAMDSPEKARKIARVMRTHDLSPEDRAKGKAALAKLRPLRRDFGGAVDTYPQDLEALELLKRGISGGDVETVKNARKALEASGDEGIRLLLKNLKAPAAKALRLLRNIPL